MEVILFYLFGGLMLGAAIMTVSSRSAVVAAVWLIFAFANTAGIFALLSAPFLAVLQILVYAGAIMVLFLFVIMMLEGPVLPVETRTRSLPRKLVLMLPTAALTVILIGWLSRYGLSAFSGEAVVVGTTARVAELLLGRYLLAFEGISLILLVAIIGALALGRKEEELPWR